MRGPLISTPKGRQLYRYIVAPGDVTYGFHLSAKWLASNYCLFFSPSLTSLKLISWRATCSFGPLLIGVFLNTILYGVRHFSLTQPGCALTRTYRFFSCRFVYFFSIISFPSRPFKYIDVHLLSVVQEARPVLCSHHHRTHILHSQPEKLHGSDTSYVIPLWLEYSHLWPSPRCCTCSLSRPWTPVSTSCWFMSPL